MIEKLKSIFLVLVKPKKAFALIKEKELSVWFIALTILSLAMFISAFLRMPVMQKASKKALAAQIKLMEKQSQEAQTRSEPPIPPEQIAQMKRFARQETPVSVILGGQLFTVIGLWVGALLSALALTVLSKIFRTQLNFQQGLNLISLAFMAFVIGELIKTAIMLTTGSFTPMQGMAALIMPEEPSKGFTGGFGFTLAFTALQRLDIFVLWSLLLLAVGATVFANLTKSKAALFALSYWFVAWLVIFIPTLLPMLLMGPMSSSTSTTVVK